MYWFSIGCHTPVLAHRGARDWVHVWQGCVLCRYVPGASVRHVVARLVMRCEGGRQRQQIRELLLS